MIIIHKIFSEWSTIFFVDDKHDGSPKTVIFNSYD